MGIEHENTTQQLKELINFSVDELEVDKPDLDALWLNKGTPENISKLLSNTTNTTDFTQYDLIDALKQVMRSANIFNDKDPHITNFIETIKNIENISPINASQKYQEAMDALILRLANSGDTDKAYCLFQFLYFTRHILRPKTQNEYFKCALVIGPIFQEAFGKKDEALLIPTFYNAFAHIIANEKYDQTYYMTSPPIRAPRQSLEQTDAHNDAQPDTQTKAQSEVQFEDPDDQLLHNYLINAKPGVNDMSAEPIPPKTESQSAENKVTELKPETENKKVETQTSNLEKTEAKKGFKIKKEHIDKAKDITVKTTQWLWHYGKILACYAWKATKFTWKHMKKGFHTFVNSAFYARMKAKIFKSKSKSEDTSKEDAK
tara:strand:+ start:176883 stop:178007 length:1125 start_codon:yes stop_codon:yes gene_type:complete